MTDTSDLYDQKYRTILASLPDNLTSEESATAMKSFETFSKTRPPEPEPEILPDPVPTTRWGKIRAGIAAAWDNETTRTVIKVAGPLAGVGVVTYASVNRDHILEKQALSYQTSTNSQIK